MRLALAAVLALTAAAPLAAQTPALTPALTLAEARASTAGAWEGQLQYRDYQSGTWEGIPMTVTVTLDVDGTLNAEVGGAAIWDFEHGCCFIFSEDATLKDMRITW